MIFPFQSGAHDTKPIILCKDDVSIVTSWSGKYTIGDGEGVILINANFATQNQLGDGEQVLLK